MSNHIQKSAKIKVIKSLVSCIVVFCLLSVSLVAFLFNDSLGWFASNNSVDAHNMQVSITGTDVHIEYYYKTSDMNDFAVMSTPEQMFSGLVPGDMVDVRVLYVSEDRRNLQITTNLDYESEYEIPLVLEDKYYYFSSQLKLNGTTFLLDGADGGLSFDSEQTPSDIELGQFVLSAGAEYVLEFSIEFVNLDVSQDLYQNFGASDSTERCYRVIHSEYNSVN